MGFVYLILEINADGSVERYKIGISKSNPEKRLKQLSTGNSNTMKLLAIYESEYYKKIEQVLHKKFKNNQTESNNEWFNLTNDEVILFVKNCIDAEDIIKFMTENNYFYK